MSSLELIVLAASVGAPLVALWQTVFSKVLGTVTGLFSSLVLDAHKFSNIPGEVIAYLNTHAKTIYAPQSYILEYGRWVKAQERNRDVYVDYHPYTPRLYLYRGVPIFYYVKMGDNGIAKGSTFFVPKFFNMSKLLRKVEEFNIKTNEDKDLVYENDLVVHHIIQNKGKKDDDNETPVISSSKFVGTGFDPSMRLMGYQEGELGRAAADPFDSVYITPEIGRIRRNIRFWKSKEDWYKSRDLSWNKKFIFYGVPGTGKSKVAATIAHYLNMPLYIFHLDSMDSDFFLKKWNEIKSYRRVILFEDFDNVYHKREIVSDGCKVSFETLLGAIDGVERPNGLVLIYTVNHIDKVDDAILRGGRADVHEEFKPLDINGKRWMAKKILEDNSSFEVERIVAEGAKDSTADFLNRCVKYSEEQLWGEIKDAAE